MVGATLRRGRARVRGVHAGRTGMTSFREPRGIRASSDGAQAPAIGVGMLGYAFMGKAHANALRTLAYMTWPPPMHPELVKVAGRNEEAVAEAAERYGFDGYATDWREVVADP